MGAGDRELDALVRADRPAEDDALASRRRRLLDEPAAVADALGGDQDALGVHAVEDVAEALALLADQRVAGTRRSSKKTSVVAWLIIVLIGGIVSASPRLAHVDEETERPSVLLLDLVERRRAREQEHQVGVLGARGPDLLAVEIGSRRRRARRASS